MQCVAAAPNLPYVVAVACYATRSPLAFVFAIRAFARSSSAFASAATTSARVLSFLTDGNSSVAWKLSIREFVIRLISSPTVRLRKVSRLATASYRFVNRARKFVRNRYQSVSSLPARSIAISFSSLPLWSRPHPLVGNPDFPMVTSPVVVYRRRYGPART